MKLVHKALPDLKISTLSQVDELCAATLMDVFEFVILFTDSSRHLLGRFCSLAFVLLFTLYEGCT